MLSPVFVKGHLNFRLDQQDYEFIHQNISVFGVTGLPWGKLDPRTHFGREVRVNIRIPAPNALNFETRAFIMRESTSVAEHMGLKFEIDPEPRERFAALVQSAGFFPTDYLRKYPRIPANALIQTFPMRVLAVPLGGSTSYVMDVSNLSPNGILLQSENQQALSIAAGHRLDLTLEPRGWFPMPVKVQGLVCRVVDEIHPQTGNLQRYLGIKFSKVDEVNRGVFLDLLKDILARIKAVEEAKKK